MYSITLGKYLHTDDSVTEEAVIVFQDNLRAVEHKLIIKRSLSLEPEKPLLSLLEWLTTNIANIANNSELVMVNTTVLNIFARTAANVVITLLFSLNYRIPHLPNIICQPLICVDCVTHLNTRLNDVPFFLRLTLTIKYPFLRTRCPCFTLRQQTHGFQTVMHLNTLGLDEESDRVESTRVSNIWCN